MTSVVKKADPSAGAAIAVLRKRNFLSVVPMTGYPKRKCSAVAALARLRIVTILQGFIFSGVMVESALPSGTSSPETATVQSNSAHSPKRRPSVKT
jgi:hypothetical protein